MAMKVKRHIAKAGKGEIHSPHYPTRRKSAAIISNSLSGSTTDNGEALKSRKFSESEVRKTTRRDKGLPASTRQPGQRVAPTADGYVVLSDDVEEIEVVNEKPGKGHSSATYEAAKKTITDVLATLAPSEQRSLIRALASEALPQVLTANKPLPPGLTWPTTSFSEAYSKYGWDIVTYLEKIWAELIKAGADLPTIRQRDPSAGTAIDNFCRRHPETGVRRELPQHVRPLLEAERNSLLFEVVPEEIVNDRRLVGVLVGRTLRKAKL